MKQNYICDASLMLKERSEVYYEDNNIFHDLYIGKGKASGEIIVNVYNLNLIQDITYGIYLYASKDPSEDPLVPSLEIFVLFLLNSDLPFFFGTNVLNTTWRFVFPFTNVIREYTYPRLSVTQYMSQATEPDVAMIDYSVYLSK